MLTIEVHLLVTLWGLASIILTVSGHALPPGQRSDDSHTFQLLASQAAGQVFEHLSSIYNRDVLNVTATEAGRNAIIEAAVKEAGAQNHADIPAHELLMRVYDAESMHSFAPIAMEILSQDFQTFLQQHQEEGGQVNRLTRRGLVDGAGKLFSRASMATAKKLRLAWVEHSFARINEFFPHLLRRFGTKMRNRWLHSRSNFGKRSFTINPRASIKLESYSANLSTEVKKSGVRLEKRVLGLQTVANGLQAVVSGLGNVAKQFSDPAVQNAWLKLAESGERLIQQNLPLVRGELEQFLVKVVTTAEQDLPRIFKDVADSGGTIIQGKLKAIITDFTDIMDKKIPELASKLTPEFQKGIEVSASRVSKEAMTLFHAEIPKMIEVAAKALEERTPNIVKAAAPELQKAVQEAASKASKDALALVREELPRVIDVATKGMEKSVQTIVRAGVMTGLKVIGLFVGVPVLLLFGPSIFISIENSYKTLWNRMKGKGISFKATSTNSSMANEATLTAALVSTQASLIPAVPTTRH